MRQNSKLVCFNDEWLLKMVYGLSMCTNLHKIVTQLVGKSRLVGTAPSFYRSSAVWSAGMDRSCFTSWPADEGLGREDQRRVKCKISMPSH